VVAFTDVEATRVAQVHHPQYVKMSEEPALPFLIKAYRSEADGVILNPGHSSRLFLAKTLLKSFIREYATEQLAKMPGPWTPSMDQNLLLAEVEKGRYTVAVYVSEADARYVADKLGGVVRQPSWTEIRERCLKLGATAPYFHFGLPEQILLTEQQIERIFGAPLHSFQKKQNQALVGEIWENATMSKWAQNQASVAPVGLPSPSASSQRAQADEQDSKQLPDSGHPEGKQVPYPPVNRPIDPEVEAGLKKLEKATIEGQGLGNGWEVCRALAELRRIWVLVDPDGNMVILAGQDQSPIVDFFTSPRHAERLIEEARQKNPNLPPMTPRLISTKKLYKALAPRKPIVWINRGSPEAWTSVMGDTLPYVLQLMSQLQKETI
jgi:hypothetical protein